MTKKQDVIVVGGGLAGLAAAATVNRAGRTAVVVEARAPGGRARTVERGEYVFNMGAHALYIGGPGMATLRRLGIAAAGSKPPLSKYKVLDAAGLLHALPVGPMSMLRTTALSPRAKVRLGKVLGLLARLDPVRFAGVPVVQWISGLDLGSDGERLLGALLRLSTYAPDFDELSAEAAITQLQLGAAKGVLYLDGGWGQLIDGLAAQSEIRRARVLSIEPGATGVEVVTDDGTLVGGSVVLAAGTPAAAGALLPDPPSWPDLGEPIAAACLDLGVCRPPSPGYVLGLEEPIYVTTQSPPARQSPAGAAVVAVLRYGVRSAELDRPDMERFARVAGVADDEIEESRFLARMVVAGAAPLARLGGLRGRPAVTETGSDRIMLAGDWVGPEGLLADAALASGHAAALAAMRGADRAATMIL